MNHYCIAPDGKGGAAVAFVRNVGQFSHNIRVQHINADGSLGFGLTGLDAANTEDNDYDYCGIAVNPKTEEILVDFESQLPNSYDVMLQKFSYDGDYLFDEMGLSIASKDKNNAYAFGKVGCGAVGESDWIVIYRRSHLSYLPRDPREQGARHQDIPHRQRRQLQCDLPRRPGCGASDPDGQRRGPILRRQRKAVAESPEGPHHRAQERRHGREAPAITTERP